MIALYADGRVDLDASLEKIEAAVRSLDGDRHSLVVVELPSRKTITVGGGPFKFFAEIGEGGHARWSLLDARQPKGEMRLTVSGEAIDVPARLCVDRDAALDAVRAFVSDNGARSARLAWSPVERGRHRRRTA